jgi:hypothetical protein
MRLRPHSIDTDLDAIMEHFADDAVFESPRGADIWGQRFVGRASVREAFAARFTGIPDVRYGMTTTSSPATGAPPSGPSQVRRRTASGSRSRLGLVDVARGQLRGRRAPSGSPRDRIILYDRVRRIGEPDPHACGGVTIDEDHAHYPLPSPPQSCVVVSFGDP